MPRYLNWIALLGLGAFFAVSVDGCSVIGLATGAIADAGQPRYQQVRGSELVRVPVGAHVSILLDDSTRVLGIYRGAVPISDSAYRVAYDDWRAHFRRGAAFPEIGETVWIQPGGKGKFRSFDAGGIELRGRRQGAISYEQGGQLVRRDERRIDLAEVRYLALEGDLPIATALRIQTEQGEQRIALDRVDWIHAPTIRNAALTGFIAGLAADAIIIAIVQDAKRPKSSAPDCDNQPDWGWGGFSLNRPAGGSGAGPGAAAAVRSHQPGRGAARPREEAR